MSNYKAKISTVTGPSYRVIAGTESGNNYLVVKEGKTGVVGVRALSERLSTSIPSTGVQSRVRVVPFTEFSAVQEFVLDKLGFQDKSGHFSQVTTSAPLVVDAVSLVV